jgi:hypothetical protein
MAAIAMWADLTPVTVSQLCLGGLQEVVSTGSLNFSQIAFRQIPLAEFIISDARNFHLLLA